MRQIAAIRTNRWGEDEERLLARLRPVFGDDVAVVFHGRAPDVAPPADVVDIDGEWVLRNGLFMAPDWGWRCGDYFYYALRAARPDYDHYWLIEPDVFFSSDAAPFFDRFRAANEDFLGYALGPFARDMRFTRAWNEIQHYRAIFALTRFSGRALDRLLPARQAMSIERQSVRTFPNDEIFAFSTAMADKDLMGGTLETYAPDWFVGSQFATDPDLIYDQMAETAPPMKLMHPVRGLEAYKRAMSKRMAGSAILVMRSRDALAYMQPEDIEDIISGVADQWRPMMHSLHRRQVRLRRNRGQS